MKNRPGFMLAVLLALTGQVISAQPLKHSCGTDQVYAEKIKENPLLAVKMQEFQQSLQQMQVAKGKSNADNDEVIVIPVVFHVMHSNGVENISRAQILDQIRILNEDYNMLNPDAVKTDSLFKPAAASMRIRFELAKRDPDGHCSDGIVRVYTSYTNNADDHIKKLSVWPNNRYLNVWVVKNIRDRGASGTILGYAQFPWMTDPRILQYNTEDGVLIRHDYIGSIGTSNAERAGRVATHEIGHWLGLFHPFQDACGGGDQVGDTPPVKDPNFGCFPRNSCSNDLPDLPDMIQNFMDYADGNCQTLFTKGQKERARYALFTYKSQMWKEGNLQATGISGSVAQNCQLAPIAAAFVSNQFPCAGNSVSFHDISYNGAGTSRLWSFPGGSPSSSTAANPTVTYTQAGVYDVQLEVSNANGSNTTVMQKLMNVGAAEATVSLPLSENMEKLYLEYGSWYGTGSSPNGWALTTVAQNTGRYSVRVRNYYNQNGNIFSLYSPVFNAQSLSNPILSFAYSQAQKNGNLIGLLDDTNDKLSIAISTDCGNSWSNIWSRQGAGLNTLGGTINPEVDFIPSGKEMWRVQSIPLGTYTNGKANAQLRFDFYSDGGGSIYLDDIHINASGTLSAGSVQQTTGFRLYPNPATEFLYLGGVKAGTRVSISDVNGRLLVETVPLMDEQEQGSINIASLLPGVYIVSIQSGEHAEMHKLLIGR